MANARGWGSGLLKSPSYKIRSAEDRVASEVIVDASIRDKVELYNGVKIIKSTFACTLNNVLRAPA